MQAEKSESTRSRKPASKTAVKRRVAVAAPTARAASVLPADEREQAVRQAAFARYEARGCVSGHELEDWLEAEAQVQRTLDGEPAAAASGQPPP